jgi:hypothetical protein
VYERKEYPFKGHTVSVRKGQAKACVRKSDSRLVCGAYGGLKAASILPGIVGIFRAPGVCYNQ